MKLSDLDFSLPEEFIARNPVEPRDKARLLMLDRKSGKVSHDFFYNLHLYLKKGDLLVLNNTKVFPARLLGKTSEGKKIEILLLELKKESNCLVKPGKLVKDSLKVEFTLGLSGEIRRKGAGFSIIFNEEEKNLQRKVQEIGFLPLPPYIIKERKLHHQKEYQSGDKLDYQTIFAEEEGSVAAPTAGLHLTKELFKRFKAKGIQIAEVTLHVGLGTFELIREADFRKHKMHAEQFFVSKKTAGVLNKAKKERRKIVALGTTTVRVLESQFKSGKFLSGGGQTDIFIYPGYRFQTIDSLITNFHLPKSSLLLLVSAFAGKDQILKAYKGAISKKYRFFSYGDGMLIV
ncbi:MAG: tRNA preQ1(34) S-adenosylmethionine ribosyltransferase-isomerase QueA [Patescibacteria group bacterium]|nr:tRNA preQ1(34) S-adenosylmethionine ribosyltransferase-isomerase QueA [Patescibacteria group bacterium]